MRALTLLVLVLALLGGRSLAAEALLTEVARIPLPGVSGRIDHSAEDAAGKRLFLAALGNDTVEVIDLASGRVVRSLTGFKEPQGAAFVPELNRLVVAEGDGDAVDILDGASLERVGRIERLDDADNVRIDAKTRLVYVGAGSGRSSCLAVIDAQAGRLVRQLALPEHPEAFALADSGPRIYVNVPGDRSVIVLDRDSGATVARWPLDGAASNFPMAMDEAAHRLLVGCRSPATLLVLDAEHGSRIAALPCCGDADDILLDRAAYRAYVVGGEGAITVVDLADAGQPRPLGTAATAPGARTGLLAADGRLVIACPRHGAGSEAELRIYRADPGR